MFMSCFVPIGLSGVFSTGTFDKSASGAADEKIMEAGPRTRTLSPVSGSCSWTVCRPT